jgi:hypothetical protein
MSILLEGQMDASGEPSKRQCSFAKGENNRNKTAFTLSSTGSTVKFLHFNLFHICLFTSYLKDARGAFASCKVAGN